MVSHVATVALHGISATGVDVQLQVSPGLASFQIVGLPDNAVKESRERVRAAFHSLGISLPAKRITVNLSPADLAKEGSHFDFPIAVGLLSALGAIPKDAAENSMFLGELGLDGTLAPVPGCLPAAIFASSKELTNLFVPARNALEASWADGLNVYAVDTLMDFINHITGRVVMPPITPNITNIEADISTPDFADVKGQESAKRAAEIAAAGGHNLLMCGPPGSGKSMIAQRLVGLLPRLEATDALEVSMIHSVAGMTDSSGLISTCPYRAPHHSASAVALCGGGLKAKPGEMSLAHRGVLFLDELPEFPRQVLETMRQPLESGEVTISRANHHVTYPARFQLIAAMNPCPCGYLGQVGAKSTPCSCSARQVASYRSRLSGPLLDRIDLHVDVPQIDMKDLRQSSPSESSKDISIRVATARDIQVKRYKNTAVKNNAEVDGQMLEQVVQINADAQKVIEKAHDVFALSGRGYHRILRVSRTIADLEQSNNIQAPHVMEALGYRYIPHQLKGG